MKIFTYLKQLNKLPATTTAIYDLGCGNGRISLPFYDAGYRVIGVDINADKIAEAKKVMPSAEFDVGNLLEMEIPEESFIIARNSLPFIRSKEDILHFISTHPRSSMYFTLFGDQDEQVIRGNAVAFSRTEIDTLINTIGPITRFSETIGETTNLAGKPRQSHVFEIYRILM